MLGSDVMVNEDEDVFFQAWICKKKKMLLRHSEKESHMLILLTFFYSKY